MKLHFVLPLVLLGSIAQAAAQDSNAAYLQGLFAAACLANLGNPEGTRKWALDHHLAAITDPASFQRVCRSRSGTIRSHASRGVHRSRLAHAARAGGTRTSRHLARATRRVERARPGTAMVCAQIVAHR